MILLLVAAAVAGPVEVLRRPVPAKTGAVEAVLTGTAFGVRVEDAAHSFTCTELWEGRAGFPRLSGYLRTAAAEATGTGELAWASAKKPNLQGDFVGGCDFTATQHDATITLVVSHKIGCYGSAGCVYERAALEFTVPQMLELAAVLDHWTENRTLLPPLP